MTKPRVFVASATESLDVAYAVQENLERDAEVTVWTQGVMRISRDTIASLRAELEASDFGVFVIGPDDVLVSRGEESAAPRDNVIFELGMFAGYLGMDRSFIVRPRGSDVKLPSDLAGLAVREYEPHRSDGNLQAALGPATNAIRTEMRRSRAGELAPSVRVAQSFRQVDWARLLDSASNELLIAVHYFDSWVNANLSALRAFVERPDSRISVVVSDPEVAGNFQYLRSLFPESSDAVLREKIQKTGRRFAQVFQDAGADASRLSFYLSPTHLSYSAQCIDGETLVLSIFEMYRRSRIDSPAFEIALDSAPQIKSFWEKEWAGLIAESRLVNPFDLRATR
ncbi:hypothetical protein GCM10009808_13650 [Microbacterium sediminicola]|uniref:CD-NTase-associated protein 12/Pycsar effector protein TIR domain-containing protein n=1 Tax=Microbacterium sediminicola TaxID=415210 RepID=A0ABP4U4V5_9MICO